MSLNKEYLGRRDYVLYQEEDGFRFGTDSVLLAWFAAGFIKKKGPRQILELGSNQGAVSLLIKARLEECRVEATIDAVEIMKSPYKVLKKNILINNLQGKINPYNADIRELPSEIKTKQYDVVCFNPPFFSSEDGPKVTNDELRLAGRFEENGTCDDFIKVAKSRVYQSAGYVVLIMKGTKLNHVLSSFFKNNLKPTHLLPVYPFADKEASMFLLAGRSGANGLDMKILPPLILNERIDGKVVMTPRLREIYEEEQECFI